MKIETTCICPAKDNTEVSLSCDISSWRKFTCSPAAHPSACQILALAFLPSFFSDLMKYGADVLENWNNIPSVPEVTLAGIF